MIRKHLSVIYISNAYHDSGLSPLQRIILCQCVWHHTWLVVIRANYLNSYCCCQPLSTPGTDSLNHFACPYTMSLHHIYDNCFILELFHTNTQSVKVSNNYGFRHTFHKFYLCTHNLLRVLTISFLAWGRYYQFHFSDLYLDWTFTKITRIHKIC